MAVKVNIEKNFRDFSLKVDFEAVRQPLGFLVLPVAEKA